MTAGFGFASLASGSTMIFSRLCGQILSTLTLGLIVIKKDGKIVINQIRWEKMKAGMREYKKFPQYYIWAALLSTLSLYLPGILLSAYFSPSIAGYFSMGQSVLRLPVALIGNSIGQVFFQRGAKSFHEGKLAQTVEETFKRLVVFSVFPMLVIMIIGKELFIIAFGSEWAAAGSYSQILSVWTLMIFLASPLDSITNILGRNEVSIILNITRVAAAAGSLVIGGITSNVYLGLWLFSITGSITLGTFILWAAKASGVPVRTTLKYLIRNLFLAAPFLASIIIFQRFNPLPSTTLTNLKLPLTYLGLLIFSIVIGIIYYLIMVLRDPSIKEALQQIAEKLKS